MISRKQVVLVLLLVVWPLLESVRPFAAPLAASPITGTEATAPRRVNVRPTNGSIDNAWPTAPIFWFGQATDTNNQIDVRIAYDSQALYVWATVVDYYLWYDDTGGSDPSQYDAFALYLDTSGDRASSPQPDDFFFVSGFRFWPPGNDPRWHRQGQGTGGGWDDSWVPSPAWSDATGSRFYNSGPNNNADRDAGWTTTLTIPWATLGQAGPPPGGTTWGLGSVLYDRDDQPPAGSVPPKSWPDLFSSATPSSWGTLAFDPPAYHPGLSIAEGTTTIRRGLNGTVADAYVGGGGDCSGGVFGGGGIPHPATDLFVQNQADVSDFPCFSKSYLKFDLSAIPTAKAIISATLRIYEFGGSDPSQAQPSYIQLSSLSDDWDETTLTWNNAPLAGENLSGTWVNPVLSFPGWPGVAASWDATELVAKAYSAGRPANLVLYSADTVYHSGKYFVSSESGDWNAGGRPTLTIVWGEPAVFKTKVFHPVILK